MEKLLLIAVLAVACFGLYGVQLDEEAAVRVLFELKHAVNRAAHAAAQQVDLEQLADGRIVFDEPAAVQAAAWYLQHNLYLDEQLMAGEGASIKGGVDILVLEFIDDASTFPYEYTNEVYDYAVTLYRPGVILIIEAEYQRMFSGLGPIIWQVKGAAEIVR